MNLITIKNRYLCVQHRVGPSDSESTDFSRARVLSGRTRSNLIHRFGETHGQQTVARSCDTIRNQRESHRICPCVWRGRIFALALSRPFVGLKNQDHWPREKLGSFTRRCGDMLAISHGKRVQAPRKREGPTSRKSVSIFWRAHNRD